MADESRATDHAEDALTEDERRHPSGGWGSLGAVSSILRKQRWVLRAPPVLLQEIATTFPETFHDFNLRLDTPGGIARPVAARERIRKTPNGKANFIVPTTLETDGDLPTEGVLRLTTIRSDDPFNTTVYGRDDRFRGIEGTRRVLLIHRDDLAGQRLIGGDTVCAEAVTTDGVRRIVDDVQVRPCDIPRGCVAGDVPECNPLMALSHHAKGSMVPAAKAIPIRLVKTAAALP